MTGPSGGDSPLTSYEATVQAARDAVAAAVATAAEQQRQVQVWMDASEPEAPAAYPVGGSPDTL
jgi:hypothetical protein